MYLVSAGVTMGGITSVSDTEMGAVRRDGDFLRLREEVAGRDVPVLALALVHVQLDGFSVAAVESLVLVEHGLDGVVARRHILEAADGIAPGASNPPLRAVRLPSVDGQAKDHLRAGAVVDLVARLVAGVGGENQQQAAVERLRADFLWKGDGEGLRGDANREDQNESQS